MTDKQVVNAFTVNETTGGGLVKRLLFPAYADAGAADPFLLSSSSSSSCLQHDANAPKTKTTLADSDSGSLARLSPSVLSDEGGGAEAGVGGAGSEASTAVRDNRSFRLANPSSMQMQMQTQIRHKEKQRSSSTTAVATSTAAIPSTPTKIQKSIQATNSLAPTSPPKVPRIPLPHPMPRNQRSVSEKVVIAYNNDGDAESSHENNINNNRNDSSNNDDDETTVYQEATGMAIVEATMSSSTSSSPPTLPATPITARTASSAANRHLPSSFYDHNDDNYDDDQNSSFSEGIRDVQDRSILDCWSQSDSKEGNTTTNNSNEEWEEEATPAQTAFGRHLLFQRVLKRNSCDSTTSEQGTVINHSQRLQEMDHDIAYHQQSESDNINNNSDDAASPATTSLYTTPPQEEDQDDENGLALPVLDSSLNGTHTTESPTRTIQSNTEIETTTKAVVGSPILRSPLRIHRTKLLLQELDDDGKDDRVALDDYSTEHEEKKLTETDEQTKHRGGNSSNSNNNRSSGILSMAIRRFGSGFTSNSNLRNSVSAPTSPQPYHRQQQQQHQQMMSFTSPARSTAPYLDAATTTTNSAISSPVQKRGRKQSQSQNYLPSSFLLRSPGSSAFQQAKTSTSSSITGPRLAPKVASHPLNGEGSSGGNNNNNNNSTHRLFDKIPEHDAVNTSRIRSPSHNNNNMKALQIARSCFSYDAVDTSMDELYEFRVPNRHHPLYSGTACGSNDFLPKSPRQHVHRESKLTTLSAADNSSNYWPVSSASWDAAAGVSVRGGVAANATANQNYVALFRPRTAAGPTRRPQPQPPQTSLVSSPRRIPRSSGGHSPSSAVMSLSEAQNLQTPQRIEMEREDALDILACLVERGVSWKQDPLVCEVDVGDQRRAQMEQSSECAGSGQPKETSTTAGDDDDESSRSQTPSVTEITAIVRELLELSLAEEELGDFNDNSETYKKRKRALEELLRSHEYALEMQRASQSASSWLQSIGRSQSVGGSPSKPAALAHEESVHSSFVTGRNEQAAGEESSASENMDLLTVKALLHSSQMEVQEMALVTERLNEELAKCRAEIGRLRSAAHVTAYRSPNRSILDESDDISVTEGDEEEEDIDVLERSFESVASAGNGDFESSFLKHPVVEAKEIAPGVEEKNISREYAQVALYETALEDANAMIRKLHRCLKSPDVNQEVPEEPPVVTVPRSDEPTKSPGRKGRLRDQEQATSSEKLFDEDNFVTDWDDLSPSIAGPPDHELRSPIVASILESWSTDHNLHESLLAWMDQILNGGDPETIPPLTLSNLDLQVRDGFTVHVLPLLLRRPDILVNVKSRVHRRTTYDISVSVDSLAERDLSDDTRRTLSTSSASHGSMATTALIDNSVGVVGTFYPKQLGGVRPTQRPQAMSRLSYDEMTEDIGPPDDGHPGLMSTLGGALGGLLTRRKGPSHESLPPEGPPSNMEAILESPSSAGLASEIVGLAEADSDQPYHRVVSAPPGRIGVTFVEYRGHCMVSDVNPDSPLIGWIFPSDVLIAIDELPVSGMRVRDIIKVLKDRTERQRALRVVSSHAMNEYTLKATSEVDEIG